MCLVMFVYRLCNGYTLYSIKYMRTVGSLGFYILINTFWLSYIINGMYATGGGC